MDNIDSIIERLKSEKEELDLKMHNLFHFIDMDEKLLKLPIEQQVLMKAQLNVMVSYTEILDMRIYYMDDKNEQT